jgi:hypothetical protein
VRDGTSPSPVLDAPRSSRTARATEAAPHERVLQQLVESDSVIPGAPPVHPFRAVYNAEAIIPPMCYMRLTTI